MLLKQGLIGDYRFQATGVLDFIHQAACIQFDPIDVCGKSPDCFALKGYVYKAAVVFACRRG